MGNQCRGYAEFTQIERTQASKYCQSEKRAEKGHEGRSPTCEIGDREKVQKRSLERRYRHAGENEG